jgi:hypothetical protein
MIAAHRAAPIVAPTRTGTRGRRKTGRAFGSPASLTSQHQNRRPSHKTGARSRQKITVAATIPPAQAASAGRHAATASESAMCAQLTSSPSTTKHKHFSPA